MAPQIQSKSQIHTWPTLPCRPHLLLFSLAHSFVANPVSLQSFLQVFTQMSCLSEAFSDHQLPPCTLYPPSLLLLYSIDHSLTYCIFYLLFIACLSALNKTWAREGQRLAQSRCLRNHWRNKWGPKQQGVLPKRDKNMARILSLYSLGIIFSKNGDGFKLNFTFYLVVTKNTRAWNDNFWSSE